MSSSPNSEMPLLNPSPNPHACFTGVRVPQYEAPIEVQQVRREFERYGMLFRYHVVRETMPKWDSLPDQENPSKMCVRLTREHITTEYVDRAEVRSTAQPTQPGLPIYVYITSDGPIMGLRLEQGGHTDVLRHPAMVQYAGGKLRLMPIFGAERLLRLRTQGITAVQPPTECLLNAYPAYILRSNMGTFLRPLTTPIHEREERVEAP